MNLFKKSVCGGGAMGNDGTDGPTATVWARELPAAAATAAGQLLLLGAGAFVLAGITDEYGPEHGEGAFGTTLVSWLLVIAPVLLPVLGLLHTALFALPVAGPAHALGSRSRIPGGVWAALLTVALAALYAAAGRWWYDLPYGATWAWVAGTGLLPVFAARYARTRDVRPWGTVVRAAAVTGAGLLLLGGGLAADRAGLLPEYRPPRLAPSQYAGEWTGDGARLVLRPDGTARAEGLPVTGPDGGVAYCTGAGTWTFDPEAAAPAGAPAEPAHRDGVWLDVSPCADSAPAWRIAGTTRRPELFALLGDPDAGVRKVLRREGGG
ncbi:hypothetical protein ABZZ17_14645 [Streptomyces sp. NPDC006512]|uniref:hypothetical protein n=1 Tax=Streptomyces sp. NPDC006512 TaxID=3154307 RepID=UPI0033B90B67